MPLWRRRGRGRNHRDRHTAPPEFLSVQEQLSDTLPNLDCTDHRATEAISAAAALTPCEALIFFLSDTIDKIILYKASQLFAWLPGDIVR